MIWVAVIEFPLLVSFGSAVDEVMRISAGFFLKKSEKEGEKGEDIQF